MWQQNKKQKKSKGRENRQRELSLLVVRLLVSLVSLARPFTQPLLFPRNAISYNWRQMLFLNLYV